MQNQAAISEHNEQILRSLLASSPLLASDITSQSSFKFLSSTPQFSNFNSLGSLSSVTSQHVFETFAATTRTDVVNAQIDQQVYANSNFNGTICSNSLATLNPNSVDLEIDVTNRSVNWSGTKIPSVQPSFRLENLNNPDDQQTTTINTLDELNLFFLKTLSQQSQQSANLENPFLASILNKKSGTGAFKFVGSPHNNISKLLQKQQDVPTEDFFRLNNALQMLRSSSPIQDLPVANKKPIPLNSPIDLAGFRVKDPYKWNRDDVVAWVLDVARRHNIPHEEIGVVEFSSQNGTTLTRLTEDDFKKINPSFGSFIYFEFQKVLKKEPINTFDNLIPYRTNEEPVSTGQENSVQQTFNNPTLSSDASSTFNRFLSTNLSISPLIQQLNDFKLQTQNANLQQLFQNPQQRMLQERQFIQNNSLPQNEDDMPGPSSAYDNTGVIKTYGKGNNKIRINKDGSIRKRPRHIKGNKLWKFILDALKDPTTCPTIVRWEDPEEGIFRIVDTEKLAHLWGEKKNNNKMTYEKLSRAMRTYYKNQILVPIPQLKIYPKKLVYKFGPNAYDWHTSCS